MKPVDWAYSTITYYYWIHCQVLADEMISTFEGMLYIAKSRVAQTATAFDDNIPRFHADVSAPASILLQANVYVAKVQRPETHRYPARRHPHLDNSLYNIPCGRLP